MLTKDANSRLNSIPPEMWTEIFDYACLDDGYTGRALSEVSRYMRFLSQDFRHRSIKIRSSDQLVRLEEQVSGRPVTSRSRLTTRFLTITLPKELLDDTYGPNDWEIDDESDDDFTEEACDDEISQDGSELSSSSSSSVVEATPLLPSELEELQAEITDNEADRNANPVDVIKISSLSDLADSPSAVNRMQYRIYGSVRRLLELCADTLEIFSFYFLPRCFIPHDLHFPPMPRLRHLSIGMTYGFKLGYLERNPPIQDYSTVPLHYPSIRVLRLLGRHLNTDWWTSILQSVPDSEDVKVISILALYRCLGFCTKQKGAHKWEFLDPKIVGHNRFSDLLEEWWLEDLNGGNGTSLKYLDEKHGHSYQYESDDDL